MIKDYRNGLHSRLTTLEEAYQLASNYVTSRRNESGRPIFLTAGQSISRRAYGARGHGRMNTRMCGRGRGHGRGNHSQIGRGPSLVQYVANMITGDVIAQIKIKIKNN